MAASQARRLVVHRCLFLKQLERPLLRLVSRLSEALQCLLARRMLPPGNNTPLLRLHQVLAGQPTARVLRRPMPYLSLCTHCRLLRTTSHISVLLARTSVVHYILDADFLHHKSWDVS